MCRYRKKRRGNILVLSAFLMIIFMAMLAFAIDVGYLYVARSELQRTADAAAIAATWELVDQDALTGFGENVGNLEENARRVGSDFAALNHVLRDSPLLAETDVTVGYLQNPSDAQTEMDLLSSEVPNAVRVRVRRTRDQNGEVPFFMAKVLGFDSVGAEAVATAALLRNIHGFRAPADGSRLPILPFALEQQTWDGLLNGAGADEWCWDGQYKEVTLGTDGIVELNLYPQATGSSGNCGTIDIGRTNNSTTDLARQITDGISASDLEQHGGSLEFDSNGQIDLNGDTGISAGLKDELASIIGKPRLIPIYETVQNPGDNAQYTIVRFCGIRIMEVKLTGWRSGKRVIIQPCNVVCRGALPAPEAGTSDFVYSPVWLVR